MIMTDKNLLELEPINISLLESLDLAIQATEEKAAIYNDNKRAARNRRDSAGCLAPPPMANRCQPIERNQGED